MTQAMRSGLAENEITALRAAFDRQRAAFGRDGAPDYEMRKEALRKLASAIRKHQASFADAISADFRSRSQHETALLEVGPSLAAIAYARRHLRSWMRPSRRRVSLNSLPGRAWVQYQPLGIVGIISPWNYPLYLAIGPLVDALAAGNRVLLKPSELTPRFSQLLQDVMAETFPKEEVAVVTGGPEIGQAFSSLPFDHLLFTGSTTVGRKVMLAAAENLTPVTLELGGKSPAIVDENYPLAKAARSIALGKFVNAGQTCIAPDYVLVPEGQAEAMAEAVLRELRAFYPAPATNPDYTSIANERHAQRLQAMLGELQNSGAKILRVDDGKIEAAAKFAPAIVLDPPPGSTLMREEIFGPILPIVSYRSREAAIAFVNGQPRPLALYIFTNDRAVERHILASTISGGVTVNGTLLHIVQEDLPFGGVGTSGIGAYHGFEGFKRFSHAKGVFRTGWIRPFEWFAPPYGRLAALAIRYLTGGRVR
jgi:coniferyl-aldehyde dehydrogenase